MTEARVLDPLGGVDLVAEDCPHVLLVDAMGGGVVADRVQDLTGTLRIGDGAAVEPLVCRDRIGGKQSLRGDIDQFVAG